MPGFRDKAQSTPQIGLCVMYPSPGAVERIAPDWDWVWLDGQHGQSGYAEMLALVRACDLAGRPAFVRVPGHGFGEIGRALDMGAAGVIVPVVNSVEEAKAVVKAAKFPPLGGRSYGGRRTVDLLGRGYSDTANEDTMLVVQIESPEAVEAADAIAAEPGVDALFLGPDDITLRRGGKMTDPPSREALGQDMETVVRACRNHGKLAVTVGRSEEMFLLCLETGFNMIVAGGDVPFLADSSKEASARARDWVERWKG